MRASHVRYNEALPYNEFPNEIARAWPLVLLSKHPVGRVCRCPDTEYAGPSSGVAVRPVRCGNAKEASASAADNRAISSSGGDPSCIDPSCIDSDFIY